MLVWQIFSFGYLHTWYMEYRQVVYAVYVDKYTFEEVNYVRCDQ